MPNLSAHSIDLTKIDFNRADLTIDLSQLVKTVDLRPAIEQMGLVIKSQNGRGTCSVFASTFLLEYMVCKERGLKNLNLSEEYLNAVANRATNRTDDGDFFANIWEGYKTYGIVDEEWFPYQLIYNPNYQPDDELIKIGQAARFYKADFMYSKKTPTSPTLSPKGLNEIQLAAVLKQLDKGVPVAFGFHGSSKTTTIASGGLTIWDDLSDELDGAYAHSVPIVGYVANHLFPDRNFLIFRNSYGSSWGDNGYGYLSFNYARKFIYDVVVYDRSPEFLPAVHAVTRTSSRPILRVPSLPLMERLGKLIHPRSQL